MSMGSRSDHSEDEQVSAYDQYLLDLDNDVDDAYDRYMLAMGYVYDMEEERYI